MVDGDMFAIAICGPALSSVTEQEIITALKTVFSVLKFNDSRVI
jgi:hypothetical protein